MRKALIIGIDYYQSVTPLHGCVNDAHSVKSMLERNADGSVNFGVNLITGTGAQDLVRRLELRDAIQSLFSGDDDVALLYFAGHGHVEDAGGYLCASDSTTGNDGVALNDVLTWANQSRARNKIIILDSCHSGIAGAPPTRRSVAELEEGLTILTASTADQYASEENGSGVFTSLLVDALGGAAANLVGDITPGAVYAHIDQSLGSWAQRPVFKTNVKRFVSLRKVAPAIELSELQQIATLFPAPGFEYQLDPTYEPERTAGDGLPPPDRDKNKIFAVLQKYNRLNLLAPQGAPHMWHAAVNSKTVKLTALGEHYRRLAERGLI